MKTKVQTDRIENVTLRFESDVHEGETLDTCVFINGCVICIIAGCDIEKFKTDFKTLITKYKI